MKIRKEKFPELFGSVGYRAEGVVHFLAECGDHLAVGLFVVNRKIRPDRVLVFLHVRVILARENRCIFILSSSFHCSTSYKVGRWK